MAGHPSRKPLSRERVLAAALGVADAEGISAVTMRRIAEQLDCEAMSLYHHVDDKGALFGGMVESVIGEVIAAASDAALVAGAIDWRVIVRRRCLAARAVMLRHPWAPPLFVAKEGIPPNSFMLYEQFVGTLIDAGFTYDLAHRAVHALGSMVFGFTQELFDPSPGAADEANLAAFESIAAAAPHLAAMAQADLHAADGALSACDTQAEFEFTLTLILDGLDRVRASTSPLASPGTAPS